MRVTTLEEYVHACKFVEQGEAIMARANAEARELTGSPKDQLVSLDPLRQDVEKAKKQKEAFETVSKLLAQGVLTDVEVNSFLFALWRMYDIAEGPDHWRLRKDESLDSWMEQNGIGRRTFFDLTNFENLHQAAGASEAEEAKPTRARAPKRTATSSR